MSGIFYGGDNCQPGLCLCDEPPPSSRACYDGHHAHCKGKRRAVRGLAECECYCHEEAERDCKQCGDTVAYLSSDDLCDGCVAEAASASAGN